MKEHMLVSSRRTLCGISNPPTGRQMCQRCDAMLWEVFEVVRKLTALSGFAELSDQDSQVRRVVDAVNGRWS